MEIKYDEKMEKKENRSPSDAIDTRKPILFVIVDAMYYACFCSYSAFTSS